MVNAFQMCVLFARHYRRVSAIYLISLVFFNYILKITVTIGALLKLLSKFGLISV